MLIQQLRYLYYLFFRTMEWCKWWQFIMLMNVLFLAALLFLCASCFSHQCYDADESNAISIDPELIVEPNITSFFNKKQCIPPKPIVQICCPSRQADCVHAENVPNFTQNHQILNKFTFISSQPCKNPMNNSGYKLQNVM